MNTHARYSLFGIFFVVFFSFLGQSQTTNVTFQVDMNQFDEPYYYGGIHLNSSFNGWCGGCQPMSDLDGDGIWSVTLPLSPDTIEYKFTIDGWTVQEWFADGEFCTSTIDSYVNRSLIISDEDVVLPPECFSECGACVEPVSGCTYEDALNYDPSAAVDDQSCEFAPANVNACPSDLNQDGSVSTADLLDFLIAYGQIC